MFMGPMHRRTFFCTSAGILAAGASGVTAAAGGLPKVDRPRATDGDEKHEPAWENKLELTVT